MTSPGASALCILLIRGGTLDEALSAAQALDLVIPFQFLTQAQRDQLCGWMTREEYAAGEVVIARGGPDRDVFLLAAGAVEAVDDSLVPPQVVSRIEGVRYFGERACLFDQPRLITIRAATQVVLWRLPAASLLDLIDRVPVFAQSLADLLRVKQGVFRPYRRLYAHLVSLVERGEFLLTELLPAYLDLQPALHPHLHGTDLDLAGLSYAVRRLPEGITNTGFYYLTTALPPLYANPDEKFDRLTTTARRRAAWRATPAKTIVLLRDGITDVSDFLTCLCLYVIEARKIRRRATSPELLRVLKAHVDAPTPGSEQAVRALVGLTDAEFDGLRKIWPDDLWVRLREILLHHEDIAIECDLVIENYNSHSSETWVGQIRATARRLVDLEDPDLDVHIISSNTHSVGNCLSPSLYRHRDEILEWGRANHPDLFAHPWHNLLDLVYVLAQHYPTRFEENHRHRLGTTAFTGIEVELFDLAQLPTDAIDPELGFTCPGRSTLIVNVDYAFGQQAEEILANLLYLFGRRVRSVNVLGKAGGLRGDRGDLLLPRAALLQTNDELYPLPNLDLSPALLRALAPDRAVHVGPVLTVAGTLLQDRALLHFYERIWKCAGLEMEGSFYARQLISAIQTGIVAPDVRTRFAYYTSDLPLEMGKGLTEPMRPWEGTPPLYAITRAFLKRIFADCR